MEIQSISGFQLVATTVTPADGRPPIRPNRHLAARLGNRYRSPPESATIDFRRGLETFDPPRIVQRPNSSQGQRKQISKAPAVQKDNCTCNESNETSLAIQEELEAMTYAGINEILSQERTCNTKDEEGSVTLECQEKVSTPSFPEYSSLDPIVVCTCSEVNVLGLENKRHGDNASTQESKAWFEKTLQQYEDLKKSVEAHITSTPSERNELATEGNPHCGKLFCEGIPFQDKTFFDIDRMDVDEVCKRNRCAAKMSGLGSPSIDSCGCPAQSFGPISMPDLDMDAVQGAAWRKMVETVAQLRETNQALQQTVRELRERQYISKAQTKPDSLPDRCSVMFRFEPELRKRVLSTLKNSVHRMESLMVALRDEQEKSRTLSSQLQGFLSSSRERTPQSTPTRSIPWSGSTSPLSQCANLKFDSSHQLQTFSTISPPCFQWTGAVSPGQLMSSVCSCDR